MSHHKNGLRTKARKRFWQDFDKNTYECPDCGRRESQLRTTFEVHHKDGNPSNNSIENLIGVCRPCHNLREGKKPSLNEIELMREQIEDQNVIQHTTPVAKTKEQATSIYQQNQIADKPNMVLYKIRRQKYIRLEIDFNTAKGWRSIDERAECDIGLSTPRLTEDTVEAVNKICERYHDKEQARDSTSALATNYGTDVIGFPPMLPEVSKRLASELRPLVMNEDNWEPWDPLL